MQNIDKLLSQVFFELSEVGENCPHCAVSLEEIEVVDEIVLNEDESIFARVPVFACPSCDFRLMGDGAEEIRDAAVRTHRNLLTAADIRSIRSRLGFSRREFSEAFGIRPASLERWENGRLVQSKSNDTLLRALANRGIASALDRRRLRTGSFRDEKVIKFRELEANKVTYSDAVARASKFSLRRM